MGMIKTIFKKSFEWKNEKKDLFVMVFFTQLIYLVAFLFVFVSSFYQIMTHSNYLMQKFYEITPEQISANMVDNPLALYSHYSSLVNAVVLLIVLSYVTYLVLNGINWSITNKIVNAKQKFFRFFPKYVIFTLMFTIPLMIVAWLFIRLITITGLQAMFLTLLGITILVFWYFMTISFSLIHNYWQWDLKYHIMHTFAVGVKKAGTLVLIGIFNVVVLCLLALLIYKASDYFIPLIIAIVLFILGLVWTRILFMTAVREASEGRITEKGKTILKM
jgi:hypothetical protein